MAGVYKGDQPGRENVPGGGHLQRRAQVQLKPAASGGVPAKDKDKEPHGHDPHNSTQIDIPSVIYDKTTRHTYTRGRLLGKVREIKMIF